MRYLPFLLSAIVVWMAAATPAAAETLTALMKTGEGSLVIGGGDKQAAATRSADSLHTMLSREVNVYVFRGAARVLPAGARGLPPAVHHG